MGVCGLGEGIGRVNLRLDRALVPEGQDGLELLAEQGDLAPHTPDVDAADRPVLVHQLRRCQQRDAGQLGG